MESTRRVIVGITVTALFVIIAVISFVIYPDVGEKILYGKHPPEKKPESLEYSQIITSGNYKCIEFASFKAQGDLPNFVKEFNDCNR